jgi:uncharacterized protein YgiM (DUF1202 family)
MVTLGAIVLALSLAESFLSRPPLTVSTAGATPTFIVLTAPATAVPTITPFLDTPTPIPTLTPIPTRDVSVAPPEITVGFYARVVSEQGLTVRVGPSTQNVRVTVADNGSVVLVLDGPTAGSNFDWWQVQLDDGTEGWVAGDFIVPAARP